MKHKLREAETRFGRIMNEWILGKDLSLVCCDGKDGRSLVVVDNSAPTGLYTQKPDFRFLTYCSGTDVKLEINTKQTAIGIVLKQEERSDFVIDLNYSMIHYRPSFPHMANYGLL